MLPRHRQLSLALVLLLVFVAAALATVAWLDLETGRLRADAVAARRTQFREAVALAGRPPADWDAAFRKALGRLFDGEVVLYRGIAPPPRKAPPAGRLGFDYPLPGADHLTARVTFALPPAYRLAVTHERMLMIVVVLATAFLLVPVLLSLPRRSPPENTTAGPWPAARSEMSGLEHLARISVERTEALARESGARSRAEEDLRLSRTLLDQSLEERIRLGRELHDNLCQTLYAVGLTLEGLRSRLASQADPVVAERLDQSIAELRRLNRDVRGHLAQLEPAAVQRQPFVEALDAVLAAQTCPDHVRLVRNLDQEATAAIAPQQAAEVANILREALSNSVRHSDARTITVHARRGDGTVLLAVQDDGAGFAPAQATGGHGLANMRARAANLGGSLEIVSAPGKGTRILVTLPVSSVA